MLLWRGALGIIAGLLLLFFPIDTATVIGILVGAWLVVDAVSMIALGLSQRSHGASCGWTIFSGVITAITGIAVLIFPVAFAVFSALAVLWITSIGLIITGIARIASKGSRWSLATGTLNVLFGIILGVVSLADPSGGLVALAWIVGLYGVLFGVLSVVTGIRIRRNS